MPAGSKPAAVFVDTSAWFRHATTPNPDTSPLVRYVQDEAITLVTSTFVFDETITLLQSRISHQAAAMMGTRLRDDTIVRMEHLTQDDEELAWARFLDRPQKGFSFTDCTSFVLMERLGIDYALSLDDDFTREGFSNLLDPAA